MSENIPPKRLTTAQQVVAFELGTLVLLSWHQTGLNFPAKDLQAVFTVKNRREVDIWHQAAAGGGESIEWELGELESDIKRAALRLWKKMGRSWTILVLSVDPVTRKCNQTFFESDPRHI